MKPKKKTRPAPVEGHKKPPSVANTPNSPTYLEVGSGMKTTPTEGCKEVFKSDHVDAAACVEARDVPLTPPKN